MKLVLNILKAFLINISFIGIIFAANSCPSISPKDAQDLPVEQAEAILGDIVCSFINLNNSGNGTFDNSLNLTKRKIIPYIDLEYSTELALGNYWEQLQPMDKKIFERDIRNSLIEDYVSILTNFMNWSDVNISVDKNFTQHNNFAEVKVLTSLESEKLSATVKLKMIRKDRWRIYDLVFQSISIVDIEKIAYDSKIKRLGLDELLKILIQRT